APLGPDVLARPRPASTRGGNRADGLDCKRHRLSGEYVRVRFLSRYAWLLLLLSAPAACGGNSQTAPVVVDLTGQWTSTLTRPPCVGDWSVFTLQLTQSGTTLTGTLVTNDNMQFPAAGTFDGQTGNVVVALPAGTGECGAITFTIQLVDHDT